MTFPFFNGLKGNCASIRHKCELQERSKHRNYWGPHESLHIFDRVTFINDERVAEGAQFDDTEPVATAACQARDLDPDDGAGATQADFTDQTLKADAVVSGFAGAAQILVDDQNLVFRPTEVV